MNVISPKRSNLNNYDIPNCFNRLICFIKLDLPTLLSFDFIDKYEFSTLFLKLFFKESLTRSSLPKDRLWVSIETVKELYSLIVI